MGDRGSGWGLGNISKHLSSASEAALGNLEVVLVREAGSSAAYFIQSSAGILVGSPDLELG